jgi:hypothetical protein
MASQMGPETNRALSQLLAWSSHCPPHGQDNLTRPHLDLVGIRVREPLHAHQPDMAWGKGGTGPGSQDGHSVVAIAAMASLHYLPWYLHAVHHTFILPDWDLPKVRCASLRLGTAPH